MEQGHGLTSPKAGPQPPSTDTASRPLWSIEETEVGSHQCREQHKVPSQARVGSKRASGFLVERTQDVLLAVTKQASVPRAAIMLVRGASWVRSPMPAHGDANCYIHTRLHYMRYRLSTSTQLQKLHGEGHGVMWSSFSYISRCKLEGHVRLQCRPRVMVPRCLALVFFTPADASYSQMQALTLLDAHTANTAPMRSTIQCC